jgi:hypothetical protein
MAGDKYKQQSELAKKYYAQGLLAGEALGRAKAVLIVLGARKLDLSAEARERVVTCSDLDRLERWVRRAVTCASADDLFAE